MDFYQFLSNAITPVVALILGVLYKGVLENVLLNSRKIIVKLPVLGEIEVNSKEAGETLTELFLEFYSLFNQLLNDHQKQFFRDLLNKDLNRESQPTVKEMIPEFNRENPEWEKTDEGEVILGMLRALRGLGLISPVGTSDWQAHSKIEITRFGKALTEHLKNRL